jgi:hypothetical protein
MLMMVYVEYISRQPGIDLADFQETFKKVQQGWESNFSEDQLILNAARTWRLGPQPEYLTVWCSPHAGFDRLDDWERTFRRRDSDNYGYNSPLRRVARMEYAGCYEALVTPIKARRGIYYVERFLPIRSSAAIRSFFEKRAAHHSDLTLNLLLRRLGRLAPDPGGLAVWILPKFASLAKIAQEVDDIKDPVELVEAGVYVDVGEEVV